MSGASVPIRRELQQFIARHIRSVEQVEILSLFATSPSKVFTLPEIQRIIQSSEKSIADCLETFRVKELLMEEPPGAYRLGPESNEVVRLACELAEAYRVRRVSVIELIYGRPADAIQDFADAFKLRKDQ